MLTEFDYAVIEFANQLCVDFGRVYVWTEKYLPNYRDQYTEEQLMAALEKVKQEKQQLQRTE